MNTAVLTYLPSEDTAPTAHSLQELNLFEHTAYVHSLNSLNGRWFYLLGLWPAGTPAYDRPVALAMPVDVPVREPEMITIPNDAQWIWEMLETLHYGMIEKDMNGIFRFSFVRLPNGDIRAEMIVKLIAWDQTGRLYHGA